MKTNFLLILFYVMFSNSVQAQSAEQVLAHIYGEEKMVSLSATNPEMIEYLVFKNVKAAYTQDMNAHKDISEFPDALLVQPVNDNFPALTPEILMNEFPVLAYEFPISNDMHGYYRIGDTGVLLIVYPEQLIKMLFDRNNQ